MRNLQKARELARARGYVLDINRAQLVARKADGTGSSGFSVHLVTGETTTHAMSFGGALLARAVCDQILSLWNLPPVGIHVTPGCVVVP